MKTDFIVHTINEYGLFTSLELHLSSNFYPPLPSSVKKIFLDGFNQYWAGLINLDQLKTELSRVYKGSLFDYGFDFYLIHEDFDY